MATAPIIDTGADDATAAPAETTQLTEVEQLAADMGWKPKDQFSGPEEKWRPAKDFILKGKEMQDGLRDTVKDLKRTVDAMAASGAKMTERALKQQAEEINARFNKAVEEKDPAAAAKAANEMRELESEAAKPSTGNPERDFGERNPWYTTNRKARALAIMTSQEEAQKGASIEDQLKAAESAVKAEFPELFEGKPAPRKAPEVAEPGNRSSNVNRQKGPGDLPANVKTAMEGYVEMFRRKMPVDKFDADKIRAEYAKDYFADQ